MESICICYHHQNHTCWPGLLPPKYLHAGGDFVTSHARYAQQMGQMRSKEFGVPRRLQEKLQYRSHGSTLQHN